MLPQPRCEPVEGQRQIPGVKSIANCGVQRVCFGQYAAILTACLILNPDSNISFALPGMGKPLRVVNV